MNIGKVDRLKIYTLAEDYAGYNSLFWSQHGLSFLIDVESSGIRKRVLFDTASYAEPILFNMKLLNINPKSIDMIILSHNHFDHTGGLFGIMKEINKEIPIFTHPSIFKVSFAMEPEFMLAGTLNKTLKEDVERLGGRWVLSGDPIRLMPGIFTLGEIKDEEKVDFEKKPTIGLYKLENGKVVLDNVEDEIGLAIVTEKGLVVVSGCSHPGIVSMVKKAIDISGVNKVYAVIGGFHLIDADNERIVNTIKALKKLDVKKIYTGHCTGFKAENMFIEEFGEDFERLHAGKVIRF